MKEAPETKTDMCNNYIEFQQAIDCANHENDFLATFGRMYKWNWLWTHAAVRQLSRLHGRLALEVLS